MTVADTIKEFVDSQYMFTAYDVTKTVRAAGLNMYHSQVNKIVVDAFNDNLMVDYTRTPVDVGETKQPYVYFHKDLDVDDFSADWVENDPTQSHVNLAQPSTPSGYTPLSQILDDDGTDDSDDSEDDSLVTDKYAKVLTKEGRLEIPVNMIRKCGFPIDKPVAVIQYGDEVRLESGSKIGPDCINMDKEGRLRLSKSTLSVHFGDCNSYRIRNNKINTCIIVEKSHA